MESNKLLYLQLKLTSEADFIHQQLLFNGFKITNKSGDGLAAFRNFYYKMEGAPGALEVSFKIVPGKKTTQSITISLSPDIHPKHVERLFNNLNELNRKLPFDLLDLEARNRIYKRLHEEGKVDAFYTGLNKEEQLNIEKQAYIPIDATAFLNEKIEHKQIKNTGFRGEGGQRAPEWKI